VFGRKGFADATVLDIAENAGLASGTVYQYFVDKGDILRYLLRELVERLHADTRMPADENGRLIVRESVLRYLEVYHEYASIFRAWWELLEPETEFTPAWLALHEKSRREMLHVVTDGQRKGIVHEAADPAITADLIVAAFERPVYNKIVLGWTDDSGEAELADFMGRLLGRGVAREAPRTRRR
jgi:AcrR family transcriptional regulator